MSKNHEGKDSRGRSGSQIRQVQEAISRRPFGWEWMWSLGITAAAGVGGSQLRNQWHSLTRAPVLGLQQPGQGKRRFPKMLTQPLAPRGLCDLREKATCHWERTLPVPGDTFSLGLLSSLRLYQSARTYQAVLGLAARMALEGWDRPPDLLPLAAVCSHQTSHSAGDLKEDET